MSSAKIRAIHALWVAVGTAILVMVVLQLDLAEVSRQLLRGGWMLLPAFVAYGASLMLSTLAWSETLGMDSRRPPFGRMLGTFWAGHALSSVTTGGSGELLKGAMLSRELDGQRAIASLVVYHYVNAAVLLGGSVIGPLICLPWVALPRRVVLGVLAIGLVLVILLLLVRAMLRRGMAGALVRFATHLPVLRKRDLRTLEARARVVDERVREFRAREPRSFWRAAALLCLVRLVMLLELWFFLLALLPEESAVLGFLLALLLQSVNQIILITANFVPAQIGVLEGGSALLFELLGFDPTIGLSVVLLRRVRRIVGVGVGLAIGAWLGIGPRRPVDQGGKLEHRPPLDDVPPARGS